MELEEFIMKHRIGTKIKLIPTTIRLCFTLFCVRIFGEYMHSGWDGQIEFVRYKYRGDQYIIPTSTAIKE